MATARNKKGFTLAEVLIIVAIVLILAALIAVAVQAYMRSMAKLEYDGYAKEVFIAAQNHLAVAKNLNYLDLDEEDGEQPEDGDNYVLRYDDRPEEKVDVSATFDQIVRDNESAKAGRAPAPVEDEGAEENEHVVLLSRFKRPSGNGGYQGKHYR